MCFSFPQASGSHAERRPVSSPLPRRQHKISKYRSLFMSNLNTPEGESDPVEFQTERTDWFLFFCVEGLM